MKKYGEDLQYLLADLLIEGLDFSPLKDVINKIKERFKDEYYYLKIAIEAFSPSPESELIQTALAEGKIKSYQKNEICKKIYKKLKGEININLEKSLNRFPRFINCIKTNTNNSVHNFIATIEIKDAHKFSVNEIIAIINQFNVKSLGYCDLVKITIWKMKRHNYEKEIIFRTHMKKRPLTELSRIITLKEKDRVVKFYSNPEIFRYIIKNICIDQERGNKKTELTYDKMLAHVRAQKRRKVYVNGRYENLHDVITPYITLKQFIKLLRTNNILAFYPSVRSLDGSMITALIDIDFSGFIKSLIPVKVLWKFNIEIVETIIGNLIHFGLPPCLTIFSGGFGCHLYYFLSEDCLDRVYTFLNYVNYRELYILPTQKSLIKDQKSPVHSQFALIRMLLAGILLYTISHFSVDKLPKEIRDILGTKFLNLMDLFILSPFSDNRIGTILLDLSPNYPSVHRIFSWNLSTGLISIPLTDPGSGKIADKYRDYNVLLEEATPEIILENIENGKTQQYFQFPSRLHRNHLESLLRPDTLLPYISVIIRFSEKWITERSKFSFQYWLDLYKLNNLHNYVLMILKPLDFSDKKIGQIYQRIMEIVDNSEVHMKMYIRQCLDDYFFRHISYSTLESKLRAFRDLEFFYRFKPTELRNFRLKEILNLMKTELDNENFLRRMFFRKFLTFFNVVQVLISYFLRDNELPDEVLNVIKKLYSRLAGFENEINSTDRTNEKEEKISIQVKLIKIAVLYNIFIKFIKELDIFSRIEVATVAG